MQTCGSNIGEELHCLSSKDMLIEAEHVKAQRREKERQHLSHI